MRSETERPIRFAFAGSIHSVAACSISGFRRTESLSKLMVTHLDDEVTAQDAVRTEWLASQGIRVLRFTNAEIFDDLEAVFQVTDRHIQTRKADD
jgi:hypothetical protein